MQSKEKQKNIIWVDKCKSAVETAYSDYFKNNDINIFAFDCFNEAFDFLSNDSVKIDLIISGYCTFFWSKCLYEPPKEEQICFSFFHRIYKKFDKLPFVLYSSIADSDARTKVYEEIEGFYSISKNDPDGLSKINYILQEEMSTAHVH